MEARFFRAAALAATLLVSTGAGYRTNNYLVNTADPGLAEQFGKAAEKWRRELSIAWIGQEMPDWYQPCVMNVQVGPHLGAGGATTFLFDRGEVYGWRMNIQGSAERVLDSVLPHEITHMIFASYFRAPLPRWADEGGATTVECASEQAKHRQMLMEFLRTGRGIAFNQMFAMTDYPQDVMPLYAQGHSLVNYLIQQGGRRKYIAFLAEGMQTHDWPAATERWYAIKDLGDLQKRWVAWVAQGSPSIVAKNSPPEAASPAEAMVAAQRLRPQPNLIHYEASNPTVRPASIGTPAGPASGLAHSGAAVEPIHSSIPPSANPIQTQVTRPQPIEQAHQIVVEWGKP